MKRIIVLLVVAAAVIGPQQVEAKNPDVSRVQTTFTPTNVDTNQDGLDATVNGGLGIITTGTLAGRPFLVGIFSEYQPLASQDNFCQQQFPNRNTTLELSPITGRSVSSLITGESLFSEPDSDSSRICVDQTVRPNNTIKASFQVTDKITGGTGPFNGASGVIRSRGTATYDAATCDNNGNCSGKTNQTSLIELCLPPRTFCGGPGGTFAATFRCCTQGQTCTEDTHAPACN